MVGRGAEKSRWAGLLMDEAGPPLCPEASARNCLISIPWAQFAAPQGIAYPAMSRGTKGVSGAP